MNHPTAPDRQPGLDAEWERAEVLCHCLVASRHGGAPGEELLARLRTLQAEVGASRADGAWRRIPAAGLDSIAWDALALIAAPEVLPRVGWLYQGLQGGGAQPYACAALLQDLLAIEGHELPALRTALSAEGELTRRALVYGEGDDPYQPWRVEPRVLAQLLGWSSGAAAPPGATAVRLRARWDDLVLPPEHKRMLREFLLWVEHRDTVVGRWGGLDTGGPIALFSGPSGTGKTFAAAVIADGLGWPLYRVDLGLLVSKYVGETEKNLNRLFAAAHRQPMVLQFDEADSLLGKRGEVKEARDRYANMEVSHLLSRIELHDGPCILTTNLRSQLDPAFTRRFQMVIEFPRPDIPSRAQLWRRLLPPRAPRAPQVEPELLGRAVNLTGGSIRNAALHAAYLAAEAGRPIDLTHVAIAVWRELGKAGNPITRGDLGVLAAHLPEDLSTQPPLEVSDAA